MADGPSGGARRSISALSAQTLVTRAAAQLLVGLGSVVIARSLGPAGRGRYYLAITVVTIAFYVANMGLEQAQFRIWSRRIASQDELFTTGVVFAAVLGGAAMAVTWVVYEVDPASLFTEVQRGDLAVVLLLIPVLLHSLLVTGLLVIAGELVRVNNAVFLGALVQVVFLTALFLAGRLTVAASLAAYVLNFAVPWGVMLVHARRLTRFRRPVPWRLMGTQLKMGAQFEPSLVFYYLNLRVDVLFVRRYLGVASVGIYSIAVVLAEIIWLVTDSLSWSVRERQGNAPPDEAAEVTMQAVRMTILLSLVSGLALAAVVPSAIRVVYGRDFAPAAPVVLALLPAVAGMAVWKVAGALLVRLMPMWVSAVISVLALMVNVVANVVLIPRLGIVGAALASTASYWSGALMLIACLARAGHLPRRALLPRASDVARLTRLLRYRRVRDELSALLGRQRA